MAHLPQEQLGFYEGILPILPTLPPKGHASTKLVLNRKVGELDGVPCPAFQEHHVGHAIQDQLGRDEGVDHLHLPE